MKDSIASLHRPRRTDASNQLRYHLSKISHCAVTDDTHFHEPDGYECSECDRDHDTTNSTISDRSGRHGVQSHHEKRAQTVGGTNGLRHAL